MLIYFSIHICECQYIIPIKITENTIKRESEGKTMAGNGRIRTDLALEATERFAQEHVEIRGVEVQEETRRGETYPDHCGEDHHGKRSESYGTSPGELYHH